MVRVVAPRVALPATELNSLFRMGLLQHYLYFQGGAAGYIAALPWIRRGQHRYSFIPFRSLAHLRLCETIRDTGMASAKLVVFGRDIAVTVIEADSRRITLARPNAG
ncbi:MAG TPA: hypothetical protein VH253_00170 [Phycisphaerae bacterium]|nr:hypothetical protein [Phycisphaerae bacterium]